MATKDEPRDDELFVEVDGEGVHLDTLDAAAVLELTVAYLALLQRVAEDRGDEVAFVGLRAIEKCGAVGTRPSDLETARLATLEATKLLGSWERPPHGLTTYVARVRGARAALPPHYRASVKMHGLERPIAAEPSSPLKETPYAAISLRAYVMRVGGSRPRAVFKSKAEPRLFSLDLDAGLAVDLGKALYKWVDIDAWVGRDPSGNIEEGRLRAFYRLDDDDKLQWSEWFKESGVLTLDELKARKHDD